MSADKLKHTPGPWRVGEMHNQSIDINHSNKNAKGAISLTIAKVTARPTWITESEANARLIAAAPQMLDALEIAELVLHPGVIGLIGNHHGAGSMNNASNAVYAIRAAIAKAKGEA